jgi:hypothetical protein
MPSYSKPGKRTRLSESSVSSSSSSNERMPPPEPSRLRPEQPARHAEGGAAVSTVPDEIVRHVRSKLLDIAMDHALDEQADERLAKMLAFQFKATCEFLIDYMTKSAPSPSAPASDSETVARDLMVRNSACLLFHCCCVVDLRSIFL